MLAVLAPLSVAATTGLLRPSPSPLTAPLTVLPAAAASQTVPVPQLPSGVQAPASVTHEPIGSTPGLGVAIDVRAVATDAVPGRALAAYQRAAAVMAQADPSCHLSWQLVAAIGKVESNHGRFGGALMSEDGVVHPSILGPRLTGQQHTSRIGDTDGGLLDGDQRVDRAVGPMQFIPSTWTIVGVDADGDGRRDPQDIDDASLATGVYLCGGDDDLATTQGRRASVLRYNHSASYVDLVLRVMAGYLHSDVALTGVLASPAYTGVALPPVDTGTAHGEPVPRDPVPTADVVPTHPTAGPTATPTATTVPTPTASPTATAPPTVSVTPTARPTPTSAPTSAPTTAPTPEPTTDPPSPTEAPSETPTVPPTDVPTTDGPSPTDTPTVAPTGPATAPPTGQPTDPPSGDVPGVLLAAWQTCLDAGTDPGDLVSMTACLVAETGLPAEDPDLLALLENPPATPPTGPTRQQGGRRRLPSARSRRSHPGF